MVDDQNDCIPYFEPQQYHWSVPENATSNKDIGQVLGFDKDTTGKCNRGMNAAEN